MIERDTQNLKLVVVFSLVSAALACGVGIAGCAGNVSSGKAAAAPGVVAVQITTAASLPAAMSQSGYAAKLSVTGGVPPYLWVTTAGQLPVGLTLNPPPGAIMGTPVKSGTYAFTTSTGFERFCGVEQLLDGGDGEGVAGQHATCYDE
jgi:Putative Ig domain